MQKEKKELPPWKPKILSLAMDGELLTAYTNAAKDPFPRKPTLLREVLNALLKRFSVPERQQILQRLQYISACERNKSILSADIRRSEIRDIIAELSGFTACRDKRSHDSVVLRRQKAVLQRHIYESPYPESSKERIFWIKKNAREMWNATAADPCVCEYAPWPSEIVTTLFGNSPNDVIEKILGAIHRMSVPALRQLFKRSRSEEEDWHGPMIIPKELAPSLIRYYGLKTKPSKTKNGKTEYEWPSDLGSLDIYVDSRGKPVADPRWLEAKISGTPDHSTEPSRRKINSPKQRKPSRTLKSVKDKTGPTLSPLIRS